MKIFLATVKLKKKKKAPFLNHECLDTEKVPLHCSFIFCCILKIGNSNFVSRHFWYREEVLRVLKGFTCFADLHVSSLWWCFFFFSSPRMSVIRSYWSYREKNVINLGEERLQLELRCNLGVFYIKLCNLVLVQFYTLQLTKLIAGRI